jgi:hypothetical protein
MARRSEADDSERLDQAFNRILAAEAEARAAVADCQAQAAQRLADAEARARRIAERTDQRLKLVHDTADRAVTAALAQLPPLTDAHPAEALDTAAQARLRATIAALADEIIGAGAPTRP